MAATAFCLHHKQNLSGVPLLIFSCTTGPARLQAPCQHTSRPPPLSLCCALTAAALCFCCGLAACPGLCHPCRPPCRARPALCFCSCPCTYPCPCLAPCRHHQLRPHPCLCHCSTAAPATAAAAVLRRRPALHAAVLACHDVLPRQAGPCPAAWHTPGCLTGQGRVEQRQDGAWGGA